MNKLKITDEAARRIYPGADAELKEILEGSFPTGFFSMKITDRIKSYEDAAAICPPSKDISWLINYYGTDKDLKAAQAIAKITIIIRALNEGWKPDWNNSDECKYYPYFKATPGGFGFSNAHYAYWRTPPSAGSRLCLKNADLAVYAGTQFLALYNDFLTN